MHAKATVESKKLQANLNLLHGKSFKEFSSVEMKRAAYTLRRG